MWSHKSLINILTFRRLNKQLSNKCRSISSLLNQNTFNPSQESFIQLFPQPSSRLSKRFNLSNDARNKKKSLINFPVFFFILSTINFLEQRRKTRKCFLNIMKSFQLFFFSVTTFNEPLKDRVSHFANAMFVS